MRLKLEINCKEHFNVLEWVDFPFEIESEWFSGKAEIRTYNLNEKYKFIFKVNNPEYSKITYKLGKIREKIGRRKAILFDLEEKHLKEDLEKSKNIFKTL